MLPAEAGFGEAGVGRCVVVDRTMTWRRASCLGLVLLAFLGGPYRAAASPTANRPYATDPRLPSPPQLRHAVEFWKAIFAEHSIHDVVLHDRDDLHRIYKVLRLGWLADVEPDEAAVAARRQQIVRGEIERLRTLLTGLHQRRFDLRDLTKEERHLVSLLPPAAGDERFLEAATDGRLRGQSGLRERFAAGVVIGRRYFPYIEGVFRRRGLPVEISRLPLVESCFNVEAYSKVGAAGLWQFMPATGRQYMRVDGIIDARRDPFIATDAAARHLAGDYDALGSWPIAITAYNHGRGGMRRAVNTMGSSDITRIVLNYDGPAFGFASRNFYVELLAAIAVEREAERYFGKLPQLPPLRYDTMRLPQHLRFADLAQAAGLSPSQLAEMNLALTPAVVRGDYLVPKGYELRIPAGTADHFRAGYAALPDTAKHAQPPTSHGWHRVRRGETASKIAQRHGITVAQLMAANGMRNANHLRVGQSLKIPRGRATAAAARPRTQASAGFVHHTVRPGQTLSTIARAHGTTVASIRQYNQLRDPHHLRAGARLRIPRR